MLPSGVHLNCPRSERNHTFPGLRGGSTVNPEKKMLYTKLMVERYGGGHGSFSPSGTTRLSVGGGSITRVVPPSGVHLNCPRSERNHILPGTSGGSVVSERNVRCSARAVFTFFHVINSGITSLYLSLLHLYKNTLHFHKPGETLFRENAIHWD